MITLALSKGRIFEETRPLLEATGIVTLLRPHHANLSKRLVKTSKLHLLDPGLLCYLLEIPRARDLEVHPARGAVFESWVVSEVLKDGYHAGRTTPAYFWRDHAGHEVDLLVGTPPHATAVEAKSGATITDDSFRGLRYWSQLTGTRPGLGWVVHGGDESQDRTDGRVVAWREIDAMLGALRNGRPRRRAARARA